MKNELRSRRSADCAVIATRLTAADRASCIHGSLTQPNGLGDPADTASAPQLAIRALDCLRAGARDANRAIALKNRASCSGDRRLAPPFHAPAPTVGPP